MKNDRPTIRQQNELNDDSRYCDQHLQEIEYDDFKSWEENKRFQRMMALEKARQVDNYKQSAPKGSKPRCEYEATNTRCNVDSILNVPLYSKLDSARLTTESLNVNRLRLKTGESYSNIVAGAIFNYYSQLLAVSEYTSTAAVDSAVPKLSRRSGYWCPGYSQNSILSIPWDFVKVESIGLVLQRWRGVCSFSQSKCGYWSGNGYKYLFNPHPEKQSRYASPISVRRGE